MRVVLAGSVVVGHGRTPWEAPAKFSPRPCLHQSHAQQPPVASPKMRLWSGSSVTGAMPGSTWPVWAAVTALCKTQTSAAPLVVRNGGGGREIQKPCEAVAVCVGTVGVCARGTHLQRGENLHKWYAYRKALAGQALCVYKGLV